MLCRTVTSTDVSKEHITSTIWTEEEAKQETSTKDRKLNIYMYIYIYIYIYIYKHINGLKCIEMINGS
jgi:hypothetical protein